MGFRKTLLALVFGAAGVSLLSVSNTPLKYDCRSREVPYEIRYEGGKDAPYGFTESVKQEGKKGTEQICVPNKSGYKNKQEIVTKPIDRIILRTPNPAPAPPPKPTYQTPPRQATGTYRVGAICRDGWQSGATGRGACSHHGGVAEWLYN